VHRLTTVLFSVGAVLGQGVRVFTTALVLRVITGIDLVTSIWIIGVVAVAWTLMGGITTVIWTDVVQFLVFVLGGVFALVTVITKVDGGLVQLVTEGAAAGKLRVLNATLDPAEAYTLWAGIFGSTFLTLASHGTDQMMAQRIFCCRGPREARKAIVWSSLGILITVLMLFLGVALHSYHGQHPLSEAGADLVAQDRNNVFPVFIVESIPPGITGLVIAAIFAAAISSLDSALAALSQTSVNSFYRPLVRPGAPDRHYVKTGHAFTVLWSLALCGMAVACIELKSDERFENLVDLALGMTSYTYGALLGCFLMAFLPFHRDGRGLLVGVPCAMLTVFALTWHAPVPQRITLYAAVGVLLGAAWMLRHELVKLPVVTGVLAATLVASRLRVGGSPEAPDHLLLAWPWMYPIGLGITLLLGWSLGRPTTGDEPVRLRG
jgi:Na+/proline symporter